MKFGEFKDRIRMSLKCFYPMVYWKFKRLHIASSKETIQHILDTHCSVSRFGDGEFNLIQGRGNGFQPYHSQLSSRLAEILKSDSTSKHIVCIPFSLINTDRLKSYPRYFWRFYAVRHYFFLKKHLLFRHRYFDSLVTRFYIDYKDKSESANQITELKKIWSGRNIVIVEGEQTRSGVGNDLFSQATSIKRILCPSENAFDCYDSILHAVEHHSNKNDLILLSLGMTATVLAFDLSQSDYQAIDLGHLDVEYEWFRQNATEKISLVGKYVNEVTHGNQVASCDDVSYQQQIVQIVRKQ